MGKIIYKGYNYDKKLKKKHPNIKKYHYAQISK